MNILRSLLLALTGLACAGTASASPEPAHSLSFRVVVDGQVVMAPQVTLRNAQPASLALEAEDGTPGYWVQMTATSDGKLNGTVGTLLAISIWDGGSESGNQLIDASLVIDPANVGQPGTVMIESPDGQRTGIEVLSHALIELDPTSGKPDCTDGDSALRVQPYDGCCNRACLDGSGNRLRCCGASGCCGCGVCCQPS